MNTLSLFILPAAVALDLLLGDPRCLPHPIRWMGKAIESFEPRFRALPLDLALSGSLLVSGLVLTTAGLTWFLLQLAGALHPYLALALEVLLIYYALSARGLAAAALAVLNPLQRQDLAQAKTNLSQIVGREVAPLSKQGTTRAAVETVAENSVDGFVAPLFYAAIGGAPLAMAYKMINTLDSMIGYRNDTYFDFGKFAARLDDLANYLPARLSVPVIALATWLLKGRFQQTWRTAWLEGRRHSSPNAGYPEAAFAGALGIKLGGPNWYHGQLVEKPYIGRHGGQAKPLHIQRACELMLCTALLWTFILGMVQMIAGIIA